MNKTEVRSFVERYLEAEKCDVIESTPQRMITRLSPSADRSLTDRPFYWSMVDRLGLEPQPMTFTFWFEPFEQEPPQTRKPDGTSHEHLYFGSERLQRMMNNAKQNGMMIQLFEKSPHNGRGRHTLQYASWLAVTFVTTRQADLKTETWHDMAIHLTTGTIRQAFEYPSKLATLYTPTIPSGIRLIPQQLQLPEAIRRLEQVLQQHIQSSDQFWAQQAHGRLLEEEARLRLHYPEQANEEDTISTLSNDPVSAAKEIDRNAERNRRLQEVRQRFAPRIEVDVLQTALLHQIADFERK